MRQQLAAIEAGFLAAVCTFALVMGTVFFEAVTPSRLLLMLIPLLLIQMLACPRLFLCRESVLYLAFVAYLFLTLLWTPDPVLGMNTLFPAVDFLLIQIIMGSLVRFGDAPAVLLGTLIGLSVVKAAMIIAYFMHLKFERLSLILTIVPMLVICICLFFVFFPDSFRSSDLRYKYKEKPPAEATETP